MSRRVVILTVVVLCICRTSPAQRWLIERGQAAGAAAEDAWRLSAAELLVRRALAELRGVTLLTKEDVTSDVATLELNRLSSAEGEVRLRLGKFARAGGLIVLGVRGEAGGEVTLRVMDLSAPKREVELSERVGDDEGDGKTAELAAKAAAFLGRAPTAAERSRMARATALSADALKALARGADATADAERELFFKQATVLSPDAPLAWYLLARQLHATGQNFDAISAYRRAVKLDDGQVACHYDLANAFFDEKRYDEAAAEYQRAIALDPTHAASHENLIRSWRAAGVKVEDMLKGYAESMEALFEKTAAAQLQAGRLYWEMGKQAEAVAAFRKAAELDPADPILHFDLAHALEQSQKDDDAIAEYKQAVALAPNYAKAHNNLAFLYEKKGRETLALFHYQQAVKFAPDYALAWNNLGILYGRRGMHRLEVEAFRKQAKLTPNDAVAWFNLGVAYHRSGRYKPAIDAYRKSLELKPDDKLTHWQLADAYERAGVWNLANEHWRKVLALEPTPEEKATAEKHLRGTEKQ